MSVTPVDTVHASVGKFWREFDEGLEGAWRWDLECEGWCEGRFRYQPQFVTHAASAQSEGGDLVTFVTGG